MQNPNISDIIARMKALQQELETELDKRREQFRYHLEGHKVRFDREVLAQQKKFRQSLARYILGAKFKHLVTAPFIYAVFFPMLLVDLFATLYQTVCFPVYGIPRVRRRDYMLHDRNSLGYLNLLEKFNCFYCSYADGLTAYLREIIGRTEQYWCPIKHARRIKAAHDRYPRFFEYGDAESYAKGLERLRKAYEGAEKPFREG